MSINDTIARINELAKKAKTEGLTPEETAERDKLRRIYIPKSLQEEALGWLADKGQDSGFIFLNQRGQRITTRGISGELKKMKTKMRLTEL